MSQKVKIFFPLQQKQVFIEKGATVATACASAGFPLDLVCGGKGKCGKCSVEIERNGLRETTLACQEKVYSELKVFLRENQIKKTIKVLTENTSSECVFNPSLKKVYIDKKSLDMPIGFGIWESIIQHLDFKVETPSLSLAQRLAFLQNNEDVHGMTLIFYNEQLIAIEKGNTADKLYGFAIDIGTTTVAAYLYNLANGERIGVYSALNGQIAEGADIITRIVACINRPDGLNVLQNEIIETINSLLREAVTEQKIDKQHIYTMVLCGNSAMQHLFLGLYPESLGKAPFVSIVKSDMTVKAEELGLDMNTESIVHFLPLIGGFVGADTTAVLLSLLELGKDSDEKKLIIDLGTNGEIVVGNRSKMLAASTAAGPALEGAGIKFGMRGTNGAIERVNLCNGKIELRVIMDEKPQGICGSGLIDVIAEMLKVGIINENGRLLKREEYLAKCLPLYRGLADYLTEVDGISVFILVPSEKSQHGKDIYISQKDIRAVQLAKGAIYTGCMLLLKEYGISGKELKEILIAGAFGNYIDVKNGQYIGLLPSFEGVPVRSIGNAAGAGVQRFLLSREIQNQTADLIKNISHIELALNPDFRDEYFKNVNFPKHKPANC